MRRIAERRVQDDQVQIAVFLSPAEQVMGYIGRCSAAVQISRFPTADIYPSASISVLLISLHNREFLYAESAYEKTC